MEQPIETTVPEIDLAAAMKTASESVRNIANPLGSLPEAPMESLTGIAAEVEQSRTYSLHEAMARVSHALAHAAEFDYNILTVYQKQNPDLHDETTNSFTFGVIATEGTAYTGPTMRAVEGIAVFKGAEQVIEISCNGFDHRPIGLGELMDR